MANGMSLHSVIGIAAGAIHSLQQGAIQCRTLTIVCQDEPNGPLTYMQIDCFGKSPKDVSIRKVTQCNPIPSKRDGRSFEII